MINISLALIVALFVLCNIAYFIVLPFDVVCLHVSLVLDPSLAHSLQHRQLQLQQLD